MDSFVEMPDVLLLPQVNLLQSSAHRSTVQKRSFNVIIAIYKQIYGKFFLIDKNPNEKNVETNYLNFQIEFMIQKVISKIRAQF